MQRGAAITLNISESNKSGSAGTVSIGHVQTCSRPEVGPNSRPDIGPKSEKSPYHSSGASDDNNSADNLKILNEPATLQLVRKGRKTTFFTYLVFSSFLIRSKHKKIAKSVFIISSNH